MNKIELGRILNIDNKKFLVIKIDNDNITLMDCENVILNKTSKSEKYFYEHCDLDDYLETEYYENLSFKEAIEKTTIEQNWIEKDKLGDIEIKGDDIFIRGKNISSMIRHVYAPSIEDFIELSEIAKENVIEEYLIKEGTSWTTRDAYPRTKAGIWGVGRTDKRFTYFFTKELVSTKPILKANKAMLEKYI